MNDQQEFFDLLHQAQQGDEQAREQCVPVSYTHLGSADVPV